MILRRVSRLLLALLGCACAHDLPARESGRSAAQRQGPAAEDPAKGAVTSTVPAPAKAPSSDGVPPPETRTATCALSSGWELDLSKLPQGLHTESKLCAAAIAASAEFGEDEQPPSCKTERLAETDLIGIHLRGDGVETTFVAQRREKAYQFIAPIGTSSEGGNHEESTGAISVRAFKEAPRVVGLQYQFSIEDWDDGAGVVSRSTVTNVVLCAAVNDGPLRCDLGVELSGSGSERRFRNAANPNAKPEEGEVLRSWSFSSALAVTADGTVALRVVEGALPDAKDGCSAWSARPWGENFSR